MQTVGAGDPDAKQELESKIVQAGIVASLEASMSCRNRRPGGVEK